MRQLHAASGSNQQVAAPARNQPQAQPSSTSSNTAAAPRAPGVAVNPKLLAEKHDKDKSDRATQEQVLDPRTRLVLAGLVNRGVIGKMDRCVSTGKEVRLPFRSRPCRLSTVHLASSGSSHTPCMPLAPYATYLSKA